MHRQGGRMDYGKCFRIGMLCSVCAVNTAQAMTWNAGELVQQMKQARTEGVAYHALLAEKIRDELVINGFRIIDGALTGQVQTEASAGNGDITGPGKKSLALTLEHTLKPKSGVVTITINTRHGRTEAAPPGSTAASLITLNLGRIDVPAQSMPLMKVNGYTEKLALNTSLPSPVQQQRLEAILKRQFPMAMQLPVLTDFNALDSAAQDLLKLVLDYLSSIGIAGELVLDVVKNNWTQVLYYVLTDNRAGLAQLLSPQALCPSLEKLKASMSSGPLYSTAGGSCAAVDARNPGAGPFYAASGCTAPISFQPENFAAFCREALAEQPNPYLGNPAQWPAVNVETDPLSTLPSVSSKWSLASAAQLAVGVEPISSNHIPFMKRVNFRQAGNCALEMRVYKKDIAATQLTPLLWMHGGSWTYRSAGFLGMESLISNYTEDNFVVFAPFYRLAGDKDANAECRNATWQDMTADIEAALTWVKTNGASLGADTGGKIAVTGQSAGAHLAGWLMTHRANEVSRGLLAYAPTDFIDFFTRLQGIGGAGFPPLSDSANTPYDPGAAQGIVETLLQLPEGGARTVDLNNPPSYLSENSFAHKIAVAPTEYPAAFILHGTRDSLLTYTQAQVLCEAYGGVVNIDASTAPNLRSIFPCGSGSQLHLFKEAEHAFELCPFISIGSACRAGSPASAMLLIDSLQQARQWLQNPEAETAPAAPAEINLPRINFTGKYTVSWGSVGGITRYELYESTDRKFVTPGTLVYNGPNTSVRLSNKPRGTYYYRVRACKDDVCGGYIQADNGILVFRLGF